LKKFIINILIPPDAGVERKAGCVLDARSRLQVLIMSDQLTPMMKQYFAIKEQNPGSILFFRLGDFYEMFFDDALEASRILHITLTSRGKVKGQKIPMCGVPFHAADNYIARLVKNGKKVAICEQVEEPAPGKNIVKREIIKIITPGTFIADELLEEAVNKYILSIFPGKDNYGLAYSDISTGEFRVTEIHNEEDLFSELYKISPSECLVPGAFTGEARFKLITDVNLGSITKADDWLFDYGFSENEIREHFKVKDLSGFGCKGMASAICAAGALLKYLKNTQKNRLDNIDVITTYKVDQYMTLDRNSQRNLELIHSMEDMSAKGTLLEVLDDTKTPMGKRRLKNWILNPLISAEAIDQRLDAVQILLKDSTMRKDVRGLLDDIYDIDRLSNKVSLGTANARDVVSLSMSLKNIKRLRESLGRVSRGLLVEIHEGLEDFKDVTGWIDTCIVDEPPVSVKDGGIIRRGYDRSVDELRDIIENGKDWLIGLQRDEVEKTGISSLKVGYNKVFGYYIEVTKTNLDAVPPHYIRKQTLTNAERFITQDLKEYESKIVGAEERIKAIEYDIFIKLRERIAGEIERLKKASGYIADLDIFSNFADVASKGNYVRPVVNAESVIRIRDGRHPVLEKILKDKEFIPNDIDIGGAEARIFIITGSNMAGKSTYIRQVALITVMAQMGCFVPAREALIGIVDRVFTRVGASDRLYRGMSTFMVEMLETANILNNATERSLIILDEIGRGTSTYDGVSIAWAVVEYIYEKFNGAKTLFATHFHELTELAEKMEGLKNYNLSIKEWGDEVIFLYKAIEGSCDESFGIHVAKLAGMPDAVVTRARKILDNLQKDSLLGGTFAKFSGKDGTKEKQLDLFAKDNSEHPVVKELKGLDINSMTPIEALKKILELKDEIGRE